MSELFWGYLGFCMGVLVASVWFLRTIEIYRNNLLDALKKATEGTPFIFDNMGYAAGEIKSYWVGNVEEK